MFYDMCRAAHAMSTCYVKFVSLENHGQSCHNKNEAYALFCLMRLWFGTMRYHSMQWLMRFRTTSHQIKMNHDRGWPRWWRLVCMKTCFHPELGVAPLKPCSGSSVVTLTFGDRSGVGYHWLVVGMGWRTLPNKWLLLPYCKDLFLCLGLAPLNTESPWVFHHCWLLPPTMNHYQLTAVNEFSHQSWLQAIYDFLIFNGST